MSLAKSEPVTENAPRIDPVADGQARPFWSVIIPTFNCARFLRQTLDSVLAQDPGPARMQIEVVDDCSTKDDPAAVVREVAKGRVAFYRNPENLGATRNFNTCIARSRGHWVHILHGDDFVLPGFYATFESAIGLFPSASMLCCRGFFVDEHGEIESLTPRMASLERGGKEFPTPESENPVVTPSVVVKRSFYEREGGFDLRLRHTADWEMWFRATTTDGAVAINQPLAGYRIFTTNDTGRLAKTGENIRDIIRMADVFRHRGIAFNAEAFRRFVLNKAHHQWSYFQSIGEREAAEANASIWAEHATR